MYEDKLAVAQNDQTSYSIILWGRNNKGGFNLLLKW